MCLSCSSFANDDQKFKLIGEINDDLNLHIRQQRSWLSNPRCDKLDEDQSAGSVFSLGLLFGCYCIGSVGRAFVLSQQHFNCCIAASALVNYSESMMGIKDWVLSQLVAKSVVSSRPLSSSGRFSDEEPLNEELSSQVLSPPRQKDDSMITWAGRKAQVRALEHQRTCGLEART
ncbi:hypothetical protein TEA_011362 [Camellia sinensis var. sinensis]|uniref:Uncharacterized protein n=1 Tax=Camellia sinensis var. sinensis TaxID=542762 RepID=A0A4S4ENB8_CAMSN|nr:hypothetical protein TEA_011362 [Camellia sinensis var. sinensis]